METKDLVLVSNNAILQAIPHSEEKLINRLSSWYRNYPSKRAELISTVQVCFEKVKDIVSSNVDKHPMVVWDKVLEYIDSFDKHYDLSNIFFIIFSAIFDDIREQWVGHGGDYYKYSDED